jgi:hypothetical protein
VVTYLHQIYSSAFLAGLRSEKLTITTGCYGTLPTDTQIEAQMEQQLDLAAGKHIDPATGGEVDDAQENPGAQDLSPD